MKSLLIAVLLSLAVASRIHAGSIHDDAAELKPASKKKIQTSDEAIIDENIESEAEELTELMEKFKALKDKGHVLGTGQPVENTQKTKDKNEPYTEDDVAMCVGILKVVGDYLDSMNSMLSKTKVAKNLMARFGKLKSNKAITAVYETVKARIQDTSDDILSNVCAVYFEIDDILNEVISDFLDEADIAALLIYWFSEFIDDDTDDNTDTNSLGKIDTHDTVQKVEKKKVEKVVEKVEKIEKIETITKEKVDAIHKRMLDLKSLLAKLLSKDKLV